jgi:hypothetical protein
MAPSPSSPSPAAAGQAADRSGLDRAADRIREAAKWLIVSFAAVGVTLFGGLQLASLGRLSLAQPDERFAAALGGVVLGLVGLAIAIGAASGVVTRSYVSLRWLDGLPPGDPVRTEIEGDRELLQGHPDVADLIRELDQAQQQRRSAYQALYQPVPPGEPAPDPAPLIAASERANYWARWLKNVESNVLQVASYNRVAAAYRRARKWMFLGAGLTAAGITAFAWGANPPAPAAAVQVLPPAPSNVTVVVPPEQRDQARADLDGRSLQQALGRDCDLAAVTAVAVGARGEVYDVVSVRTPECDAVMFRVAPELGRVLPRS